jgi:HSP20 family molecular chaperone IbpA
MKKIRKVCIFIGFILLLYLLTPIRYTLAADQTLVYDKEQVKSDYRLFLQQLKSLNAQYKEITGEIGEIMKEEGAPTWDVGEQKVSQDIGGDASIKETDTEILITLDMPGYNKDSIKVSYQDSKKLLIKAERKFETTTHTYEKTLDLPVPVDQTATSAVYKDDVLTIKLRKAVTKEVAIPIH